MSQLTIYSGIQDVASREEIIARMNQRGEEYKRNAKSDNTKRAYANDWRHFEAWCEQFQFTPLPADSKTIELYLITCAEMYKVSTIQRRIAAISRKHQERGYEGISMRGRLHDIWSSIRREKGVAQNKKAPACLEEIKAMISTINPDTLIGKRDRALLLVGFSGALRRSELVGLNVEDITFTKEGLEITIRKSKTDQEGKGQKIGIQPGLNPATCPVRTLQTWLAASEIKNGPIFRPVVARAPLQTSGALSSQTVALIVKKAAQKAGLDPSDFAGHSLRAGFVTTAIKAGASYRSVKQQTRHRSDSVLEGYFRDNNIFRDNATARLGL